MTEAENAFVAIGKAIPDAEQSQMFGKPCFKTGGKAFVCFFEQSMVFKLEGDTHQHALSLPGAVLFDPSGKKRPMKEWVQIPFEHHQKWAGLADSACIYAGKK